MAFRGVALSAFGGLSKDSAKALAEWKMGLLRNPASRELYLQHCSELKAAQETFEADAARVKAEFARAHDAQREEEATLMQSVASARASDALADQREAEVAEAVQRLSAAQLPKAFPPPRGSRCYRRKGRDGRSLRAVRPYRGKGWFTAAQVEKWEDERQAEIERLSFQLRARERQQQAEHSRLRDEMSGALAAAKTRNEDLVRQLNQTERELVSIREADRQLLRSMSDARHALEAEEEKLQQQHHTELEEKTRRHLVRLEEITQRAKRYQKAVRYVAGFMKLVTGSLLLFALYRIIAVLVAL